MCHYTCTTHRHEVNCLTKEEFERSSKSALVRQNSQSVQSPLSKSLSFNNTEAAGRDQLSNSGGDGAGAGRSACNEGAQQGNLSGQLMDLADNDGKLEGNINSASTQQAGKALALMVQPSVDYGK